jgi:putative aldouronate transport system substrate-binding protein
MASWNMENEYKDLIKNVPTAEIVPLESVSTKYGKFGLYQETPANKYVVFNKDIKNPKAAVQFLDWLMDKGWSPLMLGQEGVHYKNVNGVPQTIDANKNRTELSYAAEYALINQYNIKADWFPIMAATDLVSQNYAKIKSQSL